MEASQIFEDEELLFERRESLDRLSYGTPVSEDEGPSIPATKPIPVMQVCTFIACFTFLVFGIAITAAAEADLIYYLVCHEMNVPREFCLKDGGSSRAVTSFAMWSTLVSGIVGLTASPMLTALSDRVGRKRVMLFSVLMLIGTRAGEWFVTFGFDSPLNHWWLLAPQLLLGLAGRFMLPLSLSISVVSDLVPPESRARVISIIDAGVSTALAFSPMAGSLVLRSYNLDVLYRLSLGLLVFVFLFMALFTKESLPPKALNTSPSKTLTLSAARDILSFKTVKDPKRRRNAILLLVCSCVSFELVYSMTAVIILYVKQSFDWTAVETGYLVTFVSTSRTFIYLCVFPLVQAFLQRYIATFTSDVDSVDLAMLRMGIGANFLGQIIMALGNTPSQFASGALVESLAAIGSPSTKNAFLKYVSENNFGSFMAVYGFLNSALAAVLPAAFLKLYGYYQSTTPSAPFMVLGACFVGVFIITLFIKPRSI